MIQLQSKLRGTETLFSGSFGILYSSETRVGDTLLPGCFRVFCIHVYWSSNLSMGMPNFFQGIRQRAREIHCPKNVWARCDSAELERSTQRHTTGVRVTVLLLVSLLVPSLPDVRLNWRGSVIESLLLGFLSAMGYRGRRRLKSPLLRTHSCSRFPLWKPWEARNVATYASATTRNSAYPVNSTSFSQPARNEAWTVLHFFQSPWNEERTVLDFPSLIGTRNEQYFNFPVSLERGTNRTLFSKSHWNEAWTVNSTFTCDLKTCVLPLYDLRCCLGITAFQESVSRS